MSAKFVEYSNAFLPIGSRFQWVNMLSFLDRLHVNAFSKFFPRRFRLQRGPINTTSKITDKAPNTPVKIARTILMLSGKEKKKNIFI